MALSIAGRMLSRRQPASSCGPRIRAASRLRSARMWFTLTPLTASALTPPPPGRIYGAGGHKTTCRTRPRAPRLPTASRISGQQSEPSPRSTLSPGRNSGRRRSAPATPLPHRRWPTAWSISTGTGFSPSTRSPVHCSGLRRSWARSTRPRRPWWEASFFPPGAPSPR